MIDAAARSFGVFAEHDTRLFGPHMDRPTLPSVNTAIEALEHAVRGESLRAVAKPILVADVAAVLLFLGRTPAFGATPP